MAFAIGGECIGCIVADARHEVGDAEDTAAHVRERFQLGGVEVRPAFGPRIGNFGGVDQN